MLETTIQLLIMLVTGVAAIAAWRSATTSKAAALEASMAREMEQRPLILVSIELSDKGALQIKIENAGRRPAANIKIEFKEDMLNSSHESVATQPMFRHAIPLLAPDQFLTQLLDPHADEFFEASVQLRWRYVLSYQDPLTHRDYGPDELVLDCSHLKPSNVGVLDIQKFYENW